MNDSLKDQTSDIERLVKASQDGDRGAFDEIMRLYQRRAMRIAVRMLGNADEAAEAVQSGFVKAYLSIKKLREPKRFEAWFFRIIANTAISQRKAAKRRMEKIKIAGDCESKKVFSPEERKVGEELKEAIQRAMLKLSKKEAKAIALFGIEDLSREKVAEIMGCSAEAVRWHVFKARQKLKVLLKEYLE
ncbi:RNA polymerase sigma-H factor [subsurface metagenome]